MTEIFFQEIVKSIQRNLLTGDAFLTVLKGFWVTILISFLGLLFGSIWGGILYFLRVSKIKILIVLSKVTISILRGSPVLLLLMILYYVAFANSRIDAVYIAIIAFTLNSGAHIAEIIRSSIEAVDTKQLEAARMLGLSQTQAFFAITVPQAGKIAKPVYQNAVISLVQWTSVVGYVTITDLTRTLNVMGARTGDAFFVLFLGVLIYLGISYLVSALFSIGNKKESMQ